MQYVNKVVNLIKRFDKNRKMNFEEYKETTRKKIVFHFRLISGSSLKLTYELFPTSLREKWIRHFKQRQKEDGSYIRFTPINKTFADRAYLMNKINTIVNEINAVNNNTLPLFTNTKELDREIFNYLHEKFEEYGEQLKNHTDIIERGWSEKLHYLWLSLNEWIHVTELAMDTPEKEFPEFSCLTHVFPPIIGEPLAEEDKLFLTSNFRWGELYLGYNTLGKDYLAVCKDNDSRVITNDQVKVQTHFSSELWLNFNLEATCSNYTEMQFYHWYQNLDIETQKLVPIGDLNKLLLGRYFAGRIVLDDSFLKISKDIKAWRYDQNLKRRWNLEVFSQIEEVTKIKIID